MKPLLILRVHSDLRLGLGHVARALVLQEQWRGLGGDACIAVSGDERARRVGAGLHPYLDQPLPCRTVDLGAELGAGLPEDLKGQPGVVLVDHWDLDADEIQALRPHKVAVMEDETDAHEQADLLFQPFLEGVNWPVSPLKMVNGRKVRPLETQHGACRILRGSHFIVVAGQALQARPRREPLQPLAVHKLLVTFGGTDGPGLARRAFEVLRALAGSGRWTGACTLLAPQGLSLDPGARMRAPGDLPPFPGCRILPGLPELTRRIPEYDAVWCGGGVTLSEAMCMGIPAATWGQNERQHFILSDLALHNGCLDLGLGPEAAVEATADALAQWLGPEGQEARQEQVRDGMALVDGMGGNRVAQELWALASL
jgi:spore coat polysaccharide biosynthesis predicted glycosyltransferase SpsG